MALPGMKSTADFAADERPKNYREGILLTTPRNNSPLYALTSMMRSESTDDPEYAWWEEDEEMFTLTVSADHNDSATTLALTSGGYKLKPGDILRVSSSGEQLRITAIASDTSATMVRAFGPGGSVQGTAAAITAATDAKLMYVGSAYREGAGRPQGTSWNPTKAKNYTQIFRTPIEWTRTASKTRYRTGDLRANDRRRALGKHSIGIERALWLSAAYETTESGQPLRLTGGFLSFIPGANVKTVTAAGVDMDELESYMEGIFSYGSSEKVAWGSVKTLIIINQIIRKNSQYNWGPGEKEYGMNVKRLFTPAGTLAFMEHPLFGQGGQFLYNDLVIMDTENLKYRYIDDTKLLKDRQDQGVDGEAWEFLTEAGLEVHKPKTHYWLKGFAAAAIDD